MKLICEGKYRLYKNHRSEPYFTFVKNGQKTIEGRIRKELYAKVAKDDHIIIFNEQETESFEVIIKGIRNYISFQEMLENESLKKVLPDAESIADGVKIYRKFYSPESEQQHGVVAIEIQRI